MGGGGASAGRSVLPPTLAAPAAAASGAGAGQGAGGDCTAPLRAAKVGGDTKGGGAGGAALCSPCSPPGLKIVCPGKQLPHTAAAARIYDRIEYSQHGEAQVVQMHRTHAPGVVQVGGCGGRGGDRGRAWVRACVRVPACTRLKPAIRDAQVSVEGRLAYHHRRSNRVSQHLFDELTRVEAGTLLTLDTRSGKASARAGGLGGGRGGALPVEHSGVSGGGASGGRRAVLTPPPCLPAHTHPLDARRWCGTRTGGGGCPSPACWCCGRERRGSWRWLRTG